MALTLHGNAQLATASRMLSILTWILSLPFIVHIKTFNSREGQRTNQKYRNLVGSDQQMQWLA